MRTEDVKAAGGRVRGNLRAVNPKLVNLLSEVARRYGRDIPVTSGRRSHDDQARAMWNNWERNLRRGNLYKYLCGSGQEHRATLDTHYQAGEREKFTELAKRIAPHLSLHLRGEAVDVAPKSALTSQMLRAIRQHARVLVEARCYHIETRSKLMPSRITEDMKRRMPVP